MLRSAEQMEVREAAMRMKLQQTEPVAAAPALVKAAPEREWVTAGELAVRWHVSPTTIRRWFRDEPGVVCWGRAESRPGKKRAHLSMRIPLAVAERVRRRMARP
jgi:methylphosphotriester-DNA--protein-cysteine methyltransferase